MKKRNGLLHIKMQSTSLGVYQDLTKIDYYRVLFRYIHDKKNYAS